MISIVKEQPEMLPVIREFTGTISLLLQDRKHPIKMYFLSLLFNFTNSKF